MPQIMAICEWWSSSFLPGACWWLHSTLYQYLNVKNSFDFIMYLPATFNTILIPTIYVVQTCPNLSKFVQTLSKTHPKLIQNSDVPVLQFPVFGQSRSSSYRSSGGPVFFASVFGLFSVFIRTINH